jgi:hypothetical protein
VGEELEQGGVELLAESDGVRGWRCGGCGGRLGEEREGEEQGE